MNNYAQTIPDDLWDKLQSKGMPKREVQDSTWGLVTMQPTYAEVFDWLMSEKQLFIVVEPHWDFASEFITDIFDASVVKRGTIHAPIPTITSPTWYEAVETAIEKALTLI